MREDIREEIKKAKITAKTGRHAKHGEVSGAHPDRNVDGGKFLLDSGAYPSFIKRNTATHIKLTNPITVRMANGRIRTVEQTPTTVTIPQGRSIEIEAYFLPALHCTK